MDAKLIEDLEGIRQWAGSPARLVITRAIAEIETHRVRIGELTKDPSELIEALKARRTEYGAGMIGDDLCDDCRAKGTGDAIPLHMLDEVIAALQGAQNQNPVKS